ncbi:LysR substrate-binding domain-containing protein [Rhizobium sp. 1399]|uniref:LysR substrate-binding domain-containing protein n=1 Tax=Rhizobium sp. 1399 TaxID=2817758 RepID=UPI00286438EE|nr:LysR substrate-binding domain-containing protein [Rhizobium sp. 1399]MDR6665052.1 DNA-binding transcriptional LysR family regulator [Rhizobium sp. 1399]
MALTDPGFELRHLRYFVTLVEERNFERAAARLGIAQPGLSQQIRSLEKIVGTPLLDRSRRGVQLTHSGETLFQEARKVLAQTEATVAAINRAGRGESGRISIGYVASAAYSGAVVGSIRDFKRHYPHVEVELQEMELRQQLQRIADGLLDFGYIRAPAPIPPGVSVQVVLREPLVAMVSADHEFSERAIDTLARLADNTFITPRQPPEVGFHRNTLQACREAGFEPSVKAIAHDFTEIAALVGIGTGIALVPQSMSRVELPDIHYRPLQSVTVTSDVAIAYRKGESSPATKAFIGRYRQKISPPASGEMVVKAPVSGEPSDTDGSEK